MDVGSFHQSVNGGTAAADMVLATGATATLAYNDEVAFGCSIDSRNGGVVVPEELSVVGIDDNPLSKLMVPSLTTVAHPPSLWVAPASTCSSASSASLLRRRFQNLGVQLVVRGSTGPRREIATLRPA